MLLAGGSLESSFLGLQLACFLVPDCQGSTRESPVLVRFMHSDVKIVLACLG